MAVASSPPVCSSRCLRYSEPAATLSVAEAGLSCEEARLSWIHVHVPGMTCMTPRAFAPETMALLKPLSW